MYGLGFLFILSIPVALLTTNLKLAFNSEHLYTLGFERYEISQATRIPDSDLAQVAQKLISYWNSDEPYFLHRFQGSLIYSDKEITHLADVKNLVKGLHRVHWASLGIILLNIVLGLLLFRTVFLAKLMRQVCLGGVFTLALIVITGVSLAVAFPALFRLFHELSFANDFWQLDPRTDLLIQMFPEPFWYHSTMVVVLSTAAEAVVLVLIGWMGVKRLDR
jgi:integral membrane protein (TIGR01906 family)